MLADLATLKRIELNMFVGQMAEKPLRIIQCAKDEIRKRKTLKDFNHISIDNWRALGQTAGPYCNHQNVSIHERCVLKLGVYCYIVFEGGELYTSTWTRWPRDFQKAICSTTVGGCDTFIVFINSLIVLCFVFQPYRISTVEFSDSQSYLRRSQICMVKWYLTCFPVEPSLHSK